MTAVDDLPQVMARLESDSTYGARLAAANLLAKLSAPELQAAGLTPIRVAFLRDVTIEPLLPAVAAELARDGRALVQWVSDFDTIGRDVLSPDSELYRFEPDLIVLFHWLEHLSPELVTGFVGLTPEAVSTARGDVIARIAGELEAIRQRSSAPVLVNTFPVPDVTTLGILDAQLDGGHREAILALNRDLRAAAAGLPDVYLVDLVRLMERVGSNTGLDPRGWHTSRAPLGMPLILALAAEYATFARALRGTPRKCLVLDCDGTLWGGVVGEDGPTGISLGPTYPGSAYVAFQREILNLRSRGILIAIASKNNESDVLEVLRTHPSMLIREQHLAARRINWADKASNLIEIANELNIGVDSLVFADDSPFESALIRERLPEVAVIQLGTDPSRFARTLLERGWFDSLAYSREDRSRADLYAAEGERQAARQTAATLEDFLAGLGMVARISRPSDGQVARVAQLTQKTNQFNLTTTRHTEGELRSFLASETKEVLALGLRDRFADLGIVGAAILDFEDRATARVDALLLSCRVLGRGVEDAFLAVMSEVARGHGAQAIVGEYRPTAKNAQVADFYPRRGFRPAEGSEAGERWRLDLDGANLESPPWIAIEESDSR